MSDTVNIQLGQDLIKPIIETKIKAAIMESFNLESQFIEKLVETVLKQKVDRDGKPSTYSSDKYYIDYLIHKSFLEMVRTCVQEVITEKNEQIKIEIHKQLSSKKGIKDIVETFSQNLISSANQPYRWSINLTRAENG